LLAACAGSAALCSLSHYGDIYAATAAARFTFDMWLGKAEGLIITQNEGQR
jgi:hypothetical protein